MGILVNRIKKQTELYEVIINLVFLPLLKIVNSLLRSIIPINLFQPQIQYLQCLTISNYPVSFNFFSLSTKLKVYGGYTIFEAIIVTILESQSFIYHKAYTRMHRQLSQIGLHS